MSKCVSRAIRHCHYEAAAPDADDDDERATVTDALEEAPRWGPGILRATSATAVRMPIGPGTRTWS